MRNRGLQTATSLSKNSALTAACQGTYCTITSGLNFKAGTIHVRATSSKVLEVWKYQVPVRPTLGDSRANDLDHRGADRPSGEGTQPQHHLPETSIAGTPVCSTLSVWE